MMQRSLRILVAALACVFVTCLQVPVFGDTGDLNPNGGGGRTPNGGGNNGGGITILPGGPQRTMYFAAGEDICIALPDCMANSIVRMNIEGHWTDVAFLRNGSLCMAGATLQEIHRAGVAEFSALVVNPDGLWLLFVVSFDELGNVKILIY